MKLTLKEQKDILSVYNPNNKNNFKKLCLLSHFDSDNLIDKYVIYMIKELYKLKFDIVFITTSERMKATQLKKISPYIKLGIIKKNRGYDFISWKTGLSVINDYSKYKQILNINDSIFFPLFNPKKIFDVMKYKKKDFWGLNDCYKFEYHIQSFFWVFNERIIKSRFYDNFWNNCKQINDKQELIRTYEVSFASLVKKNNFKVDAYCKVNDIHSDFNKLNKISEYVPSTTFWNIQIDKFKVPYLKKNIILKSHSTYNMNTIFWESLISNKTFYNQMLIKSYCKQNINYKSTYLFNEFNEHSHLFNKFINELELKDNIVIYGYSAIAQLIHSILKGKVVHIVDKNYLTINSKIKIINPQDLATINYDTIVICAFGHELNIINSLEKQNINIDKIITFPLENRFNIKSFFMNITSLLGYIKTINIQNQMPYTEISIYVTNNILLKYIELYNNYLGLNKLIFIKDAKYINNKNIIFKINDKIINKTLDTPFFLR